MAREQIREKLALQHMVGAVGLQHLAVCWVLYCWAALNGDLLRSVSRFNGADVYAVSCEIRLWGSRQLRL